MAEAGLECSNADIALSVTRVASPDRDEDGKPVRLVYLACARRGESTAFVEKKFGKQGRSRIRYLAAAEALTFLAQAGREGDR